MLITEVYKMRFKEFVKLFGNVIERCPLAAAAVWSDLPVRNLESLQTSIEKFVDQLSSAGEVFASFILLNTMHKITLFTRDFYLACMLGNFENVVLSS